MYNARAQLNILHCKKYSMLLILVLEANSGTFFFRIRGGLGFNFVRFGEGRCFFFLGGGGGLRFRGILNSWLFFYS